MRSDVARDLEQGSKDFLSLVWPVLSGLVGAGEVVPVESVSDQGMKRDLDVLAGIDAWQVVDRLGMRGIASRVQPVPRYTPAYNTFSIRRTRSSGAETEYTKRLRALSDGRGWLCPHLTIQAYVTHCHEILLSAAAVRTQDLFAHVKACVEGVPDDVLLSKERKKSGCCYLRQNHGDGNTFIAVPWAHLTSCDVPLKTHFLDPLSLLAA